MSGSYYHPPHGAHASADASAYPGQPYTAQQYGYADQHTQQHQQHQSYAPQIRNPFAPPSASSNTYVGHNADYDPEYEAQVAQWQATYAPANEQPDKSKKGRTDNANFAPLGVRGDAAAISIAGLPAVPNASTTSTTYPGVAANPNVAADANTKTVVRKGGGQTWEDSSLLEWDPTQFRIMVGNLAGEVTDDSLAKAFASYGVSKARVVRDKRSTKSKGYGFVSFFDGEKGFKAAREMVGKYIGSHPVTIKRSTTNITPVENKAHHNRHDKRKKNHNNHNHKENHGRQDKQGDVLRAHTGAQIEKKAVKNPAGLKLLG